MSAPIGVGDDVVVVDARQFGAPPLLLRLYAGPWTVVEICGVAAFVAPYPRALNSYPTPLSNLLRFGGRPLPAPLLPLAAAVYCGDGHAWYPARPGFAGPIEAGDVMWFPVPEIPAGCRFRWATLAEAGVEDGLDLADAATVAHLLYASALDPAGRPVSVEQLQAAVLAQTELNRCDLGAPMERIAQDASDHPHDCLDRMTWSMWMAERLIGAGT